jgi:hypothetical protein
MNDPDQRVVNENKPEDEGAHGPNLVVLYSLIALALAVAIGLAMLIVWPFYQRR